MQNFAYELLLIAHSYTRYAVLLVCLLTAGLALVRGRAGKSWSERDSRLARAFVGSIDLQVLLGLSLYFGVSPLARAARQLASEQGWAALWSAPLLRFFGVLHPALSLAAAITAHTAWVLVRRAQGAPERHRRLAIGAAFALLLFLAAVPWPFLGHERPWLRF